MRKNSKVLFLSLIVLAMAVILAGCGVTVSCPTCESCGPTCQPQECWLEVTSASSDVWGYVWIDGQNSGVYLTCFSTVKVLVPCNRNLVVQIIDQYGVGSHWEYYTPGTARIVYYYW